MSYFYNPPMDEAEQGQVLKMTVSNKGFQVQSTGNTKQANHFSKQLDRSHTHAQKSLKMLLKTDFAIETLACPCLEGQYIQHKQSKVQTIRYPLRRNKLRYIQPSEFTQCETNEPQLNNTGDDFIMSYKQITQLYAVLLRW